MAIPDSDPRAKDLDAAFQQAMEAPARPRVAASTPPELDPDAPLGRAEDGTPLEPYGRTKDGRIRRSAGGRPKLAKDDPNRPRTETGAEVRPGQPDNKPAERPAARDWTPELDGFADAIWFGLSAVSQIGGQVPVLGKLIPDRKLAAQAFILAETKPQLIGALNLAAQHNARAAAFCQRLQGGDGLWALTAMFMVMPVVSMSAEVWKGHAIETPDGTVTIDDMGKLNGAKLDETLRNVQAAIAAQAAAAQAAVQPQPAEAEPAGG